MRIINGKMVFFGDDESTTGEPSTPRATAGNAGRTPDNDVTVPDDRVPPSTPRKHGRTPNNRVPGASPDKPLLIPDDDVPRASPRKHELTPEDRGPSTPKKHRGTPNNRVPGASPDKPLLIPDDDVPGASPDKPVLIPEPKTLLSLKINSNGERLMAEAVAKHHSAQPNALVVHSTKARIDVTRSDLGRLLPDLFGNPGSKETDGWLNDDIVNHSLKVMVMNQCSSDGYDTKKDGNAPPPQVHVFNSAWYANAVSKPETLANWADKANLTNGRLLHSRIILLPVCLEHHWRLVVLNPQVRTIDYLDSLHKPHTRFTDAARALLKAVLGDRYNANRWEYNTKKQSATQKNEKDCGVFVYLNAVAAVKNFKPDEIDSGKQAVDQARVQMALTLLSA